MTPLNPARTITAPYVDGHPPRMPERIAALLAKPAIDLTRRELLDLAADAANRCPWDLQGSRDHVAAICDLAGTLEADLDEARTSIESLLAVDAALPDPPAEPSGALEELLVTGPDEPGPHDVETLDQAIDDDETRVATDAELACPACGAPWGAHAREAFGTPACPPRRAP